MAEIRVNQAQWESVSAADRNRIIEGLRQTQALSAEDVIVGDPAVPAFTEETELAPMWNPVKDLCKAACDVTAGAALAWCTANTLGVGLAVCIAAAETARQACKDAC